MQTLYDSGSNPLVLQLDFEVHIENLTFVSSQMHDTLQAFTSNHRLRDAVCWLLGVSSIACSPRIQENTLQGVRISTKLRSAKVEFVVAFLYWDHNLYEWLDKTKVRRASVRSGELSKQDF